MGAASASSVAPRTEVVRRGQPRPTRATLRLPLLVLALAASAGAESVTLQPSGLTQLSSSRAVLILAGSVGDAGGTCVAVTWAQSAGLPPPSSLDGRNDCTLRAAIELANTMSPSTSVTVLVAAGRIRLQSSLPEATGRLQIVGSAPPPEPDAGSADDGGGIAGGGIVGGGELATKPNLAASAEKAAGLSSPVGTILDGGGAVQILRTGAGSEVHLNTLQFERGSADQLLDADARAGAGGCVNSLGALVLQNVAMRNCKAVNGGALASEGGLEASKSVFTHNVARHCGGGIYVALGSKAHLAQCHLEKCHDACGRLMIRDASAQAAGREAEARKRALPGGSAAPSIATNRLPEEGGEAFVDASGAIAQGPSLVGGQAGGGGKARRRRQVVGCDAGTFFNPVTRRCEAGAGR
ncbi:hypothetical protein EMIHUDRAFT_438869 [Emiliania huxleyi CCMP1516]|uniref:Right handed beta helix domain-containing protein n=2 Tax=Emiliania huxleyi TaxID=2903 RepID=A0A0D3I3A1_EMIH1|nr:hypothetical protein EMIHUDRAFT_438869 [Emiliania huxleyi CCMP1516]EOD05736.1 hypothetical protein EMIHUDRAFT_438869 [Emiliania huxleyi CCMP1516]|eukprot:XP_005758165.1 hypothetical protein EMIHUDRAFT_438869 [Emiliania huxleyi CCMP1516]